MRRARPRQATSVRDVLRFMAVGLLAVVVVGMVGCDPAPRQCPLRLAWMSSGVLDFPACGSAWATFGFDAARSEVNPTETAITPVNVGRLRRVWGHSLPQVVDSSAILVPGVSLPDGTFHDVLYLTTKDGRLLAVDAATGTQLWGTASTSTDPNKITTSSPVADLSQMVVYSYELDGKVHKYQAATGHELRGDGWPVTVTTMPASEKVSSSLNIANNKLYVTTASFGGDAPPYQGHVVVIDLLRGTTRVFNSLCAHQRRLLKPGECPDNGAGIWARAGVIVDPVTGNIFLTTSNGPYTANRGGQAWGESVLELTGDGMRLLDSYTPAETDSLSMQDLDLGSSAPVLLPEIASSSTPYLLVQADKEGLLRLLNRQNLSGQNGPGHIGGELQALFAPDHCPVLTQPIAWSDPVSGDLWVFVTNNCAVGGYQVFTSSAGVTRLREVWTVGVGATSPIIAGGVLFAATLNKEVVALDPRTGHRLWGSAAATAGGSIGSIHWESPIVVGNRLYCTDESGRLLAYALP